MTDAKSPAEIGDIIAMTLQLSGTPDGQYETTIEIDHGGHNHAMAVSIVRYSATVLVQTGEHDEQGNLNRDVSVRQFDSPKQATECFDQLIGDTETVKANLSSRAQIDGMFAAAAALMREERDEREGSRPQGWASV